MQKFQGVNTILSQDFGTDECCAGQISDVGFMKEGGLICRDVEKVVDEKQNKNSFQPPTGFQ